MEQPRHAQAMPARQQQGQQGRPPGPKERIAKSKLWVLDGRIYNYAKPGATQVCGKLCAMLPGTHLHKSW